MSIDLNAPGPSSAPPSEFERTPPQNIEAEQGVLGGMLLSARTRSPTSSRCSSRPTSTGRRTRPSTRQSLDLYARGEPADAVTVMAELNRRGDARAGRRRAVPAHARLDRATAASAGYYAKIVAEQAILRRLVEAGTRIVQLGYAGRGAGRRRHRRPRAAGRSSTSPSGGPARTTSASRTCSSRRCDEIEAIESRDGIMTGVPTGFVELDKLTNGLHPGHLVDPGGPTGVGKALALDTPLPTPTGWTTMGEVQVGDYLLGSEGQPTRVVAATEVLHLPAVLRADVLRRRDDRGRRAAPVADDDAHAAPGTPAGHRRCAGRAVHGGCSRHDGRDRGDVARRGPAEPRDR